ncbi:DNA-directed RNA polymerase [Candidatus Bathyarchaeota archaeon]|nr:DNA-directed RNA polymerase [Candidatus Bathyarchaeota archaeon]MBS7631508.1 DNA-directed RNA polymerase [Candidatus Bathyarchaeota archaeon]
MFNLLTLKEVIRITPKQFSLSLKEAAINELRAKYEGLVDEDLGYVISVIDAEVNPVGRILPGDGGTHHQVIFTILTFLPQLQEVVEGEVIEVADFGTFLRIGPVDALLHVSQLIDDFISYDEKQGILLGKETGRTISKGDLFRVRIIAVSFPKGRSSGKIGVTARQPFLGKLEWIEKEIKKIREEETGKQ